MRMYVHTYPRVCVCPQNRNVFKKCLGRQKLLKSECTTLLERALEGKKEDVNKQIEQAMINA